MVVLLGILCGSCESGGVSALLDRCVSCSNAFIVLVPLLGIVISIPMYLNVLTCSGLLTLVVILVALFITIVLVDKHAFSLFYPFTFYVQVGKFKCDCGFIIIIVIYSGDFILRIVLS